MNRGVIASLRDFVPIRPLTRNEALRIAELQAQRFHELLGNQFPPLSEEAIAQLPKLQVERMSPLPVSGASHWAQGRWLIVLNGAEPLARQRFSLAHEFKHILDHRFIGVLYTSVPAVDRAQWVEQVCDYFAGCLLMPRPWVKRLYGQGIQRLPDLAVRFGVSQQAMQVRLNQIGLTPPAERCSYRRDWALFSTDRTGSPKGYTRLGPVAA
jgi:Zn-dependent peptidase ImmA (M78 family)